MKIIYLSEKNLRDRQFVQEFCQHYTLQEPAILLHEHFGSIEDTRFVSKRLSAVISECNIPNNAFSGDQRSMIRVSDDKIDINKEEIAGFFNNVHLVIINPVAWSEDGPEQADAVRVLEALKAAFDPEKIILFPDNPKSPLVADDLVVVPSEKVEQLKEAYEEEAAVFEKAALLAPSVIASPTNYSR